MKNNFLEKSYITVSVTHTILFLSTILWETTNYFDYILYNRVENIILLAFVILFIPTMIHTLKAKNWEKFILFILLGISSFLMIFAIISDIPEFGFTW